MLPDSLHDRVGREHHPATAARLLDGRLILANQWTPALAFSWLGKPGCE
jgi:hypothetical protein